MTKREITVEDALVIRIMLDFPGGLELHIGVCTPHLSTHTCDLKHLPAPHHREHSLEGSANNTAARCTAKTSRLVGCQL